MNTLQKLNPKTCKHLRQRKRWLTSQHADDQIRQIRCLDCGSVFAGSYSPNRAEVTGSWIPPEKKKAPRPKESTLRNKCDAIARQRCYERGECQMKGFYQDCAGRMEWCHVASRRYRATRHMPENCLLLCSAHHRMMHDHPVMFSAWFEEMFPGRRELIYQVLARNEKVRYEDVLAHLLAREGTIKEEPESLPTP
jgi:hypothetical protein